jgi:hypothetical protein
VGERDRFGALNLLDQAAALRGVAAARRGAAFNLNLDMELPEPPLYGRSFGGLTDPQAMAAAFRDAERGPDTFVHFRLLPLLGSPIGELWDLDALASDCASDGVYQFLLTAALLNLRAGVASPANALAVK